MRKLYHLWLSPFSRKVRLALGEKKLAYELELEKVWERRPEYLALNPTGEVPVLIDADGTVLADSTAICEYLDEIVPDPGLVGATSRARAEARRLAAWFDLKFNREVTRHLVGEKVVKRLLGKGQPDSEILRAGKANLRVHLAYIGYLGERRNWLAGDSLSVADLAAAGHLSALDYLGDVPWDEFSGAKDWYARIKSRPSFKHLLRDVVPGIPPAAHYADLNF